MADVLLQSVCCQHFLSQVLGELMQGHELHGHLEVHEECTCNSPSADWDSTAATMASQRPAAPPMGVALLPKESMQGLADVAQ